VRLLVVEDERKLARALASALEAEHYEVVVAPTGEEGFFQANAAIFDLVVLDLMLPGRGGLEILQALRNRHIQTPVLILTARDGTSVKDGDVEVKFKPISGSEGQAGGLVWRARDANNYYVARANALENNVTIYHTVNGRRTEAKRTRMTVAGNQWHTLRVDFQGNHFTVLLDGKNALDWSDETFKDAGKVGVWTKADSVTLFDDFTYGAK